MTELATERINIRTTHHAKAMIEKACQLSGVSMSSFVLSSAYDKAVSLLQDNQRIVLSPAEWQHAVQQLEDNTPPNAEMQALLARGKTLANR